MNVALDSTREIVHGATGSQRRRAPFWKAAAIDAYRSVLGLALAAHFAKHLALTAPMLAGTPLYDPASLDAGFAKSWLNDGPPLLVVSGFFGLATALALLSAARVASRLCAAALYVLAALTYWALSPIATVDEYAANLVTLTLVILPTGAGVRDHAAPKARAATHELLLLAVLGLYVIGWPTLLGGRVSFEQQMVANAFRLIAVALIVPMRGVQVVAAIAQVALHAYLLVTGSPPLANVALAVTAWVFWRRTSEPSEAPLRVDTGAVVLGTCLLIALPALARDRTAEWQTDTGLRMLAHLGVFPAHHSWPASAEATLVVGSSEADAPAATSSRKASGDRMDIIASRLAALPADSPLVLPLSRAAAIAQCQDDTRASQTQVLWLRDGTSPRKLASFWCAPDQSLLRIQSNR